MDFHSLRVYNYQCLNILLNKTSGKKPTHTANTFLPPEHTCFPPKSPQTNERLIYSFHMKIYLTPALLNTCYTCCLELSLKVIWQPAFARQRCYKKPHVILSFQGSWAFHNPIQTSGGLQSSFHVFCTTFDLCSSTIHLHSSGLLCLQ